MHLSKPLVNSDWSYSPETLNSSQNKWFCGLEIWWMTLKNNRAPLLWYFKLCALVNSNWSYSLEMAKLGLVLCGLDLWPLTLTFCTDISTIYIYIYMDCTLDNLHRSVFVHKPAPYVISNLKQSWSYLISYLTIRKYSVWTTLQSCHSRVKIFLQPNNIIGSSVKNEQKSCKHS